MWTFLFFFVLVFGEAFYETAADSGKKSIAGLFESMHRAIMLLAICAWMAHFDFNRLWEVDLPFWKLVGALLLIRFVFFDPIYNLFRTDIKLPIFYVGFVKYWDKFLRWVFRKQNLSLSLAVLKVMALIFSFHLLELKWATGIVTLSVIGAGFLYTIIAIVYNVIKK